MEPRPPLPPFTHETATRKVRAAVMKCMPSWRANGRVSWNTA